MPASPITAAFQNHLREIFAANEINPKTKSALKYEYFFVQGAYAALGQQIPPALLMLMMAGRSIMGYQTPPVDQAVGGTQRHDFQTEVVRARLENSNPAELTRMLDEALHVIDGLRQDMGSALQNAANVVAKRDSQWLGEKRS
jgi:hypothetical protein